MAFKFCPECGFKFDKEYKFCPECGFKEARQLKQNYRLSRISVSTLRELIKYADEGDAECQYLVGSYYDNRGSRKDNPDKAFYY